MIGARFTRWRDPQRVRTRAAIASLRHVRSHAVTACSQRDAHRGRRWGHVKRTVWPALLGAVLSMMWQALSSDFAHAAPRKDIFIDESVGRVAPGEVRLGLWGIDYGLRGKFSRVQVSTATLPYLSFVIGVPSANFEVKGEPWRSGGWRSSISGGLTYARFDSLGARASTYIVPMRGMVGYYGWRRWGLLAGIAANLVTAPASVDSARFEGAAFGSNFLLPLAVEFKATSWLRFAYRRSFVLYQSLSAEAQAEVNDRTTATAYAQHKFVSPFANRFTSFDVMIGGERVGLRLGISVGDIELPWLHMVVPQKLVLPRGDLFVRF